MDIDYLKILVTIILAVLGWSIGHFFTDKRSIKSRRRDLVTEYLIAGYRVLTNEVSHREVSTERNEKLENILSDIQLFGSIEQISLAKAMADTIACGGEFQLDPLINSLRDDLRSELNLRSATGNIRWLRFDEKNVDV